MSMDANYDKSSKTPMVYDAIYGFIKLTPLEFEIIHSPFYQRLRWIKQLGFSFYVFPGAEHSRFGHSIGAMNNAHRILKSIEIAVPFEDLADNNKKSKEVEFHRSVRLGALLHDLGTFCFSHTTEAAYIAYGETTHHHNGKGLGDDHENLGAFIIKNTDYEGGITFLLKKYGLDPQLISDMVKGKSYSILANSILHSDIDCDRMDYLLRDAHYTGLMYGTYDRDYLLHHFKMKEVAGRRILTIKQNALHCIEDFLMSRFSWYSQVIRSPRGAKYDAIAERICFHMLEKGLIHKYSDLMDMVANNPMEFWNFNDNYFITAVFKALQSGALDDSPQIKNMAQTLVLAGEAQHLRGGVFKRELFNSSDIDLNGKLIKKIESKIIDLEKIISKKGTSSDWIIADLPKKGISFAQTMKDVVKKGIEKNILLERDPVKISADNGDICLLPQVENSIISKLVNVNNYIPNVFCSNNAYELIKDRI